MTEIKTQGQAIIKSKKYLVNPIGVPKEIVDDDTRYEQYKGPPILKPTSEGDTWIVGWKGDWGDKRFNEIMDIHIRKADGVLLYWRNYPNPSDKDGHGAIGWRISPTYWVVD